MSDTLNLDPVPNQARLDFRGRTRAVVQAPGQVAAHMARLGAAMEMPGAEPARGALADLFRVLGPKGSIAKAAALQMVASRLPVHVRRSFEARVTGDPLPAVTTLASRWSVLAIASADVSTRARRVSTDDSRALAADVLRALQGGDLAGQEQFLHHCMACRDAMAFMLARLAARKAGLALSPSWDSVGDALEREAVGS
jgi:hypothetical protein